MLLSIGAGAGHTVCMRRMLLAVLLAGCGTTTHEARAVQPNPVSALRSADTLPVSVKLYIHQRDAELEQTYPRNYLLRSWAQFAMVTRDRVRFHVGIVRRYEDEADTAGWRAWLEDESGHRLAPDAREVARINRIAMNWRLYPWDPSAGDGYCREPPCMLRIIPGNTAYEGEADFTFHEPGLLKHRALSLVLERHGTRLKYTWEFGDHLEVHHWGKTRRDDELGTIVVPGPNTELAATRYENEDW